MTETPEVDPQVGKGADANQAPVSPEPGKSIEGATPSSDELLALRKQLAQVTSELRGLQGRQDKEKSEVQKFMEEVRAKVASGMSLDDAERAVSEGRKASERDALLDALARKVLGDDAPQSVSGAAGNSKGAATQVSQVFAQVGLDVTDPAVQVEMSGLVGKSQTDIELAAYRFSARQAKTPTPTGAQQPVKTSGEAPRALSDADADRLYLRLEGLYREPTKNATEIAKVEKEMREAGLL